ncbi:MAG: PilW family protein [Burkholderiales bacterium]|nr:PilW family protein [Burkholderiales bacterium]
MMSLSRRPARRSAGLSLIDILVGMVIGLIGMIVVFQSFSAFEGQKRSTTAGNDAQESGLLGLTSIEREARLAGYGMFYAGVPICTTLNEWNGGGIVSTSPFMPVRIIDGGSGLSDTVTVSYALSAFAATPSQVQVAVDGTVQRIMVDNTARNAGFAVGNIIFLGNAYAVPRRPCARLQVSSLDTTQQATGYLGLNIANGGATPANPPIGSLPALLGNLTYGSDPSLPSVVVNMGGLRRVQYSVTLDSARNGQLMSRDLNAAAPTDIAIADGIVNLQAQYGVAATATDQNVNAWVEPTGIWAIPTEANAGRIKAVRIALVARSQLLEREIVQQRDQQCRDSTGAVINANGPCAWFDAGAPTITLSADPEWRRYRYRVYETIIPMRNVMWQAFQ